MICTLDYQYLIRSVPLQPRSMIFALTVLAMSSCSQGQSSKPDEKTSAQCAEWIQTNGQEPGTYVLSKFTTSDLVMLGELHEIKENCEFVAFLVPRLHKAGVNTLCTEFVRSQFNDELSKILLSANYDEQAVIQIFRKGPWPTWGYKEYLDIIHAAWKVNRSRPGNSRPFRIVGIDSDWKQVDLIRTNSPAEKFRMISTREKHMIHMIETEVFAKNAKALLHIGFAHTVKHGERLAKQLGQRHNKRMFQVCMHHEIPMAENSWGMTSFLEDTVRHSGRSPVGFDVVNSPFSPLRSEGGIYFKMLGDKSTFSSFAQGYVFLKPVRELTHVTWVPGFIVPQTYADALEVAEGLKWVEKGKCTTYAELDTALAARLKKR